MFDGNEKLPQPIMPPLGGSLEFYCMRSEVDDRQRQPLGHDGFYWRDEKLPHGNGPFLTLWDACLNYKATVEYRKVPESQALPIVNGQVIEIDFKARKRVK